MKVSLSSVENYIISTILSTLGGSSEKRAIQLFCILSNLRIIILFEFLWNIGIKRFEKDGKIRKLYTLK